MIRTSIALVFVVGFAHLAHAAPAPKTKDPVSYFPTRLGDKRQYEVRDGDRVESTYTDVVTKVEKADGSLNVTITRDYSDSRPFVTVIAVSADGLFRISSNGRALDRPVPLLKFPPRIGTKWDWEVGESKTSYEIVREEEVEVPASKYKALRVESSEAGEVRTILWFAPSVGLVKMTNPGSTASTVLKAFTPGK